MAGIEQRREAYITVSVARSVFEPCPDPDPDPDDLDEPGFFLVRAEAQSLSPSIFTSNSWLGVAVTLPVAPSAVIAQQYRKPLSAANPAGRHAKATSERRQISSARVIRLRSTRTSSRRGPSTSKRSLYQHPVARERSADHCIPPDEPGQPQLPAPHQRAVAIPAPVALRFTVAVSHRTRKRPFLAVPLAF